MMALEGKAGEGEEGSNKMRCVVGGFLLDNPENVGILRLMKAKSASTISR